MNIKAIKTLGVASTALLLASCGGGVPSVVSTPAENIDAIPLKVADLSDMEIKQWSHMDLMKDTVPGMSVTRTYNELIGNKRGETVIVAVIDSGVDIEHEDLDGVIWTNEDEIPGNGIDDDNNGYVDDIHGWNFLGDAVNEQLEMTRIVARYRSQFANKNRADVPANMQAKYDLYQKAKLEVEGTVKEAQQNQEYYKNLKQQITAADAEMRKATGKDVYTKEDLAKVTDPKYAQSKGMVSNIMARAGRIEEVMSQLDGGIAYYGDQLAYNHNVDFKGRTTGDDVYDINDTGYGDANVMGPASDNKENAKHGTHVAGIIAAERNNGIGMNGAAQNVKIMAVRAVPNGDEYDKDIALAIRYAVDNGAKVINGSFGKYYSENSEWVRDAIAYAAKKDVLFVNAAGNEGTNLDTVNVYPNDQIDNGPESGDTFLTVGALNYEYGSNLLATFSNYGKINVDVFAPGVKIWSTTPHNKYEFLQGTSMAAPNAAGVAAMIRSYYPKLSAAQVKQILMSSGTPTSNMVILGGDENNKNSLANVSTSGRMVNMYNAFKTAASM